MSKDLNWHIERPFEGIVNAVVPSSKFKRAIEDTLLDIYAAEHYDFAIYKQKDVKTTYDIPIVLWTAKRDTLLDQAKKEEDSFKKLFEKLQKLDSSTTQTVSLSELSIDDKEESSEEEAPKPLKKKNQEELLLKQIQSSMATSQQRLLEIQSEIEDLQTKINQYEHYQWAARFFLHSLNTLVLSYEKTKDKKTLIQNLDSLLSYCDTMKRRYSSEEPCAGSSGLCKTHHLPLEGVENQMCAMMSVQ